VRDYVARETSARDLKGLDTAGAILAAFMALAPLAATAIWM
jgi:hypothetical protein